MDIILSIPSEKTFQLPEGNYRAKLESVGRKLEQSPSGPVYKPRLLFEVSIPSLSNCIPMAGKTFAPDLRPGSELRRFLESWFGRLFFEQNAGKSINLDTLVGREADIALVHVSNSGYEHPLVCIQGAFPPGTLKLTEQPVSEGGKD